MDIRDDKRKLIRNCHYKDEKNHVVNQCTNLSTRQLVPLPINSIVYRRQFSLKY